MFLSAILLSSFLWGPGTLSNLKSSIDDMFGSDQEEYTPGIAQVLRPEQIVVRFDADLHTVVPFGQEGVWADCADQIKAFSLSENIGVEEIDPSQIHEVMGYRSVQVHFSYNMPFKDFCECYEISWSPAFDQIESMASLGYSSASPESLFVYDEANDRHYRLIAEKDYTEFEAVINDLEAGEYVPYYSAGTYFGVENQAVIPLSLSTALTEMEVGSEELNSSDAQVQRVAETFFGESFDFVRKITESRGAVIYMYGYSEKVLSIKSEGTLEYRESIPTENLEQTYAEALNTALQFVSAHGGWPEDLQPYLVQAKTIEQDRAIGYRFTFGMEMNGAPTYYASGSEPIQAEVFNGKVTYYCRDLAIPTERSLKAAAEASSWDAFPAVNMIAQNYEYLSDILIEAGALEFREENIPEEVFDQVANQIDRIQAGYFLEAGTEEMVPVWCLVMGDVKAWFSLYDAYPLGYQLQ
ncbi:MAG: hypothetical protein IJO79_02100 [Firmicutes bacterium]|nr:hypothetical protein [Bacillota bacterium]